MILPEDFEIVKQEIEDYIRRIKEFWLPARTVRFWHIGKSDSDFIYLRSDDDGKEVEFRVTAVVDKETKERLLNESCWMTVRTISNPLIEDTRFYYIVLSSLDCKKSLEKLIDEVGYQVDKEKIDRIIFLEKLVRR